MRPHEIWPYDALILGVKFWRQEEFSDGKNIRNNFGNDYCATDCTHKTFYFKESWNVTKFSWGIEEELAEIVNGTLQVKKENMYK